MRRRCLLVVWDAGSVVDPPRSADGAKNVAGAITAMQLAHEVDFNALERHVVEPTPLLFSMLEDLVTFEQAHLAHLNVLVDFFYQCFQQNFYLMMASVALTPG